jgi:hypothetical protein
MPMREEFTEEFAVDVRDVGAEPSHAEPARPSGDVVVTVDDLAVVREVAVARDWRSRMRPHQLAPALLEAATAAVAKRCEEHWQAFDLDAMVREALAVPPPEYRDPIGLTDEILDLIERAPREQDDLLNRARAEASAETRVDGLVTVVLTGRRITAVDVDESWARIARYTEIAVEATSAFQAAQRKAPPLGEHTIDLPPAMARLRELTADPDGLARQLGLTHQERTFR